MRIAHLAAAVAVCAAVALSGCRSTAPTKQAAIPPVLKEQLDKTFPGWHLHQVDPEALVFFENNCRGNPTITRGDFNGDGLEDVGLLIDQGKQRLLIIAQRVKGTADYSLIRFEEWADYLRVSRKGAGGYDHNTGKGFVFPHDAVEANTFEKSARAYIFWDGKYHAAATSD